MTNPPTGILVCPTSVGSRLHPKAAHGNFRRTIDPSSKDLRGHVEAALRFARDPLGGEYLPYYLLFEQEAPEHGEPAQDIWTLARATLPRELPSLRLVRLKGGDAMEEGLLARHLRAILRRNP